jgi:hypothetical protein
MRTLGMFLLLTSMAFLVAGMAESQQPPGGFGG